MPDSWRCICSILSLVIAALFAYSESYLSSLNRLRLSDATEDGSTRAKALLKLYDRGLLPAVSLKSGTFLFSIAAVVLACNLLVPKLIESGVLAFWSYTIIAASAAAVLLLFSVIFPERLAYIRARETEKFASSGMVCFLCAIFTPLSFLLVAVSGLILRLFGIDPKKSEDSVTEDEIRDIVDSGEESGIIESGEKEMIENIFDFSDVTAGDIMTHRTEMTAISLDLTDEEIVNIIETTGYSRFPVYNNDQDNIIGILSARQYFLNLRSGDPQPLQDILWAPYLIPESVHADTLLRDMRRNKTHMAVVLDEYGGTAGIITMEDLLEEIVGNIWDETDDPTEDQEIIKLGDGFWRIAGSCPIDLLSEELDIDFGDDPGFETLGGLVFSQLTVIPDDGECPVVDAAGLHIEVEKLNDRHVEWAKVSKLAT